MKDSIVARVEFSFRGQDYELESVLDLREVMRKYLELPTFHRVLAMQHGIDTYSYLYEVMLEEPIQLSHPQGLAAEFLRDGEFDIAGYIARLGESESLDALRVIASTEMGVEDLDAQPKLKAALMRAYQLGLEA
jgi:hypothetical protein